MSNSFISTLVLSRFTTATSITTTALLRVATLTPTTTAVPTTMHPPMTTSAPSTAHISATNHRNAFPGAAFYFLFCQPTVKSLVPNAPVDRSLSGVLYSVARGSRNYDRHTNQAHGMAALTTKILQRFTLRLLNGPKRRQRIRLLADVSGISLYTTRVSLSFVLNSPLLEIRCGSVSSRWISELILESFLSRLLNDLAHNAFEHFRQPRGR